MAIEPATPLADGGYWSVVLDAELRQEGRWLRLIDPKSGKPVPIPEEIRLARLEAEADQAEARTRLAREKRARQEAEAQTEAERLARQAAEEQARQLWAALADALARAQQKPQAGNGQAADQSGEE